MQAGSKLNSRVCCCAVLVYLMYLHIMTPPLVHTGIRVRNNKRNKKIKPSRFDPVGHFPARALRY